MKSLFFYYHLLIINVINIEYVKDNVVDVVLMDESMPGLTGLQTLQQIKEIKTNLPVVLITKNEAENLMDEAIGSQISDYLIKPVNPNQVWLSLKKIIDTFETEKYTKNYFLLFRDLENLKEFTENSTPDFNNKKEIIHEAADLLYHFLVLLEFKKISVNSVLKELEKRKKISGIKEKNNRKYNVR